MRKLEIDITPLAQKWITGDIENHSLAIVADSMQGDFHNFAFRGTRASHGLVPVLEVIFDENTTGKQ